MEPLATPQMAPSPRRFEPLTLVAIFTGVFAAIFALMAVIYYQQATSYKASAKTAHSLGYADGQAAQKTADDTVQRQLSETPFSTYTAPSAAGAFVVNYPKGWSASVSECTGCSTPVDLYLTPGVLHSNGSQPLPAGVHVQLVSESSDRVMNLYDGFIKQKKLTQSSVTVSGIPSVRLDGQFDKFNGSMVAVTVRDKTLLFWNENTNYKSEFAEVLAQAKITP